MQNYELLDRYSLLLMTLDNCDSRGHHNTVAFTETETTDTTHLSSEAMAPESLMGLFKTDILNLSSPELEDEKNHLIDVAMLALARYLADMKDDLAHWKSFLPVHHPHPNSGLPLQEAHVRLEEPLYYQVLQRLHRNGLL